MRSFYYVTAPKITVHNVEGDWAAVVTWKHNDLFKDATITLTPDKDCEYDKTPITVPAAQDSCYISAGSEFSKKYAVYHQWWDDSKAQYYEPVIYDFTATFSGEIDGIPYTVATEPVKYIFLDRAVYAADKQFNVYRMGRIGNRTWLLEDLRGNSKRMATSPLGFKACFYGYYSYNDENIIPEGCHLASDDDWQDLEYTYGIEKTDMSQYYVDGQAYFVTNRFLEVNSGWSWYKDTLENEKRDTIKYVGQNVGIAQMLFSENEWVTHDTIKTILKGRGGFNARPFGVKTDHDETPRLPGCVAIFLTSTIEESSNDSTEDKLVIRVLWSGNCGIGRWATKWSSGVYYLYRCVKDE